MGLLRHQPSWRAGSEAASNSANDWIYGRHLPGDGLTVQRRHELHVLLIDVAAEVRSAVVDPGGQVGDVDRQRRGQIDNGAIARGDDSIDPVAVPARNSTQNLLGNMNLTRPRALLGPGR